MEKIKIILMSGLFALFLLSAVLFSLSAADQSRAAETKSLVVQPAAIEIKGQPKDNIKKSFTIINRGDLPVRLKLVPKDFRVVDEKGTIEVYEKSDQSMKDWLIPEFLEIYLKPLQTKDIQFIVAIPDNASAGGHFGAITFEPADSSSLAQKGNFGILVLTTVTAPGTQVFTGGKIVNFSSAIFQEGNPIKFNLTMHDLGNTNFTTQGTITIKNWRGKEIAKFDTGQMYTYPGINRRFVWQWTNTPSFGFYRAEVSLTNSNKNSQQFSQGYWFFVFPWKEAVGTMLGLAAALFVLASWRDKIFSRGIAKKIRQIRNKFPFRRVPEENLIKN